MNTEKFWSMIEDARQQSRGNIENLRELLIEALCDLPPQEIQEFDRLLWSMMRRAFRSDLWEVVWLIACGCGDDAFDDFRNWLIAQGQTVYEKVLEKPEYLASILTKEQRFDIFDGWMASVAEIAYERKTKQPIPITGYGEKLILIGGPLKSENELPAMFPQIVAKFGECDDDDLFS